MIDSPRFRPGDLVYIHHADDIVRTLDTRGCRDGMPFMPEMLAYCGRPFRVWRCVEKTCVEGDRVRRLRRMVYLDDVRCDGSAHGGCEKACRIFWHEEWLCAASDWNVTECSRATGPFPFPVREGNRYVCQSTELIHATEPMSKLDVRQYVRDIVHRTWGMRDMMRFHVAAIRLRVRAMLLGRDSISIRGIQIRTPSESKGLQSGERVRVKSRVQIAATLDKQGRNRGLEFPMHMLPFVGRTFRVHRPVRRIILETTGEMKELANTVALACATCDGYGRWGGCPRDQFHLWRENWLERVPELTRIDDDAWDRLVAQHPDGTLYHLSGWRRALMSTYPHIRGSFYALPDGGGIPAYEVSSRWFGHRTVCAPFAAKCGPLWAGGSRSATDLSPWLRAIMEEHRSQQFEWRAQSVASPARPSQSFHLAARFKHHVLRLDGGPDGLMRRFSRTNVRQRIRRAGEEGLVVSHEDDAAGLIAFYELFSTTRRRLGLPVMSFYFFENMARYLPAGTVRVTLARRDDQPEAALLALRYKSTLHFEYSGSNPAASASGANQLVWWSAMCRACEDGLLTVSLGCTDADNEGLLAYKRHWGAEEEDLATFVMHRHDDVRGDQSRLVKDHGVVRWFFQHAPAPLHKSASRFVYRHWG